MTPDLDFTSLGKKPIPCALCGKPKSDHKALTLNCPIGPRHRILSYTNYSKRDVFVPERLRADGRPRTPKQKAYLAMAVVIFWQQMDGHISAIHSTPEIDRLLRLARATREDL